MVGPELLLVEIKAGVGIHRLQLLLFYGGKA